MFKWNTNQDWLATFEYIKWYVRHCVIPSQPVKHSLKRRGTIVPLLSSFFYKSIFFIQICKFFSLYLGVIRFIFAQNINHFYVSHICTRTGWIIILQDYPIFWIYFNAIFPNCDWIGSFLKKCLYNLFEERE